MEGALILKILNMIQAGFSWLASRGITKERAQNLIDLATSEDRDVTTAEVQGELDLLQTDLDDTANLIDATFDNSD